MLKTEFIERTGFEPTDDEYREIEADYYNFSGNKDAFCEIWVTDGKIQEFTKKRAERIACLESEIKKLKSDASDKIAKLEAALENEQEWCPWESKDNVTQKDYEELAKAQFTVELSDDEAKILIADEFGFDISKIKIIRVVNKMEINRHRRLRCAGQYSRGPLYNATDWNYIRFDVGSWCYEMYNGDLHAFYF